LDGEVVKIRLFIKPYCPWCYKAIGWLDDHGVKYETLDVIGDVEAYNEMVELSGQTLAPVIDVDGEILADFGLEELEKFWDELKHGGTKN
jgi:glutaredoxin 3